VIDGTASIDQVGLDVLEYVRLVASGEIAGKSEENKHREFQVWAEQSVSL
jgi:altronate hydrolase